MLLKIAEGKKKLYNKFQKQPFAYVLQNRHLEILQYSQEAPVLETLPTTEEKKL